MPFLHHTGLTVADLERSLRFWRDAMGMEVLFQQEKDRGYLEAIVGEIPGEDLEPEPAPLREAA